MTVSALFGGVIYHIDRCSFESQEEADTLEKSLAENGAVESVVAEKYTRNFCETLPPRQWRSACDATHIFSKNRCLLAHHARSTEPRLADASVLFPQWVTHSVLDDKLQDIEPYHLPLSSASLFAGHFVHAVNLGESQTAQLYALVEKFGGKAVIAGNGKHVTHLVAANLVDGALAYCNSYPYVEVVSPLYFGLCVYLGRTLPIPKEYLLRAVAPEFLPNSSPKNSWLRGTKWQVSPSLWAYLDQDSSPGNPVGTLLLDSLRQLVSCGAELIPRSCENFYLKADFVISNFAVDCGRICGNIFWLSALLQRGIFIMPSESPFWQPLAEGSERLHLASQPLTHNQVSLRKVDVLKNMRISISGFASPLRLILQYHLSALGATFTFTLDRLNTHLIAHCEQSPKAVMARTWGIHIVNFLWLEAVLTEMKPVRETSSALFTIFDDVYLASAAASLCHGRNSAADSGANTPRKQKRPHDAAFTPPTDRRQLVSKGGYAGSVASRSAAPSAQSKCSDVVVATTACRLTPSQLDGISNLGGRALKPPLAVDELEVCTHLICPKLLRTEKLLVAVGLGKWVVLPSWLDESLNAGFWVDERPYLVCDEPALLGVDSNCQTVSPIRAMAHRQKRDTQLAIQNKLYRSREKAQALLQRGISNPSCHLLNGKCFYVLTSTVPSPEVVGRLVKFGGGRVVDTPDVGASEPLYVLTHATNLSAAAEWKQRRYTVLDWEYLLTAILNQELPVDVKPYLL